MANLQSSLNSDEGLGTASLSTIYITLVLSCFFLPPIIIKRIGKYFYISKYKNICVNEVKDAFFTAEDNDGKMWCISRDDFYKILNNEYSDEFDVTKGVKQGGPLSPFLFAQYIDEMLIKMANMDGIARIGDIITGVIAYADDIMILANSQEQLQHIVNILYLECVKLDMIMNIDKTKVMLGSINLTD